MNIDDYIARIPVSVHSLAPLGVHTGPYKLSWNGIWDDWIAENQGASEQAVLKQLSEMLDNFPNIGKYHR